MAESPLVNSEVQRNAQEDQQQTQTAQQSALYGGGGIPGYGATYPGMFDQNGVGDYPMGDMAPGYAAHKPSGFTAFVSHMHGAGALRTGRYTAGPYRGMEPSEAYEKMHDDYLNLSPEQRSAYIARENEGDVTDAAVAKLGPQNGQSAPFNPGSMNDGNGLSNRGHSGPVHYSINDVAGNDSNINHGGTVGAQATPAGQRYVVPTLASAQPVQQPSVVPHPMYNGGQLATMGNPADTARYGPVITSQTAPTYIGQIAGRNGSTVPQIGNGPQLPRFDAQGTLATAPAQMPRYDAGGTLISPSDTMGANGMVADQRAQRAPAYVPIPAPAKAMATVR